MEATFADFALMATRYYGEDRGGQRLGQAVFNYLYQVRPDIAEQLRGTRLDPFHKSVVDDEVWEFIESKW